MILLYFQGSLKVCDSPMTGTSFLASLSRMKIPPSRLIFISFSSCCFLFAVKLVTSYVFVCQFSITAVERFDHQAAVVCVSSRQTMLLNGRSPFNSIGEGGRSRGKVFLGKYEVSVIILCKQPFQFLIYNIVLEVSTFFDDVFDL